MAGRFVIRVDYHNGGFIYLSRDFGRTGSILNRTRKMWLRVTGPAATTRFWTREAAEGAAFVLTSTECKGHFVTVREWDGNTFRNP